MNAVLFVFLRCLFALPLLALLARLLGYLLVREQLKKNNKKQNRKVENPEILVPYTASDIRTALQLGILGVTGNLMANAGGILLTQSPFKVSLFQQLQPIVTTSISAFTGRENVNPFTRSGALKWGWIFVAISGAFLVIAKPGSFTWSTTPNNAPYAVVGDILLLVNVLSYSLYLTFAQPHLSRIPPITLTAWTYMGGMLPNIICLVLAYMLNGAALFHIPRIALVGVMYSSILSSSLAYILINWCNHKTSPPIVTAFVPLQTVIAALLSAWVFGSEIHVSEGVGAVVVCMGVCGLVWTRYRESIGRDEVMEGRDGVVPSVGATNGASENEPLLTRYDT
ncbi:hypothetical protein BC830DRAFT_1081683 [Chytriomyces sp. MP71]|nr:hypothetical protein BC830DRAFT_1081683 [Chytriomyces sp. MP71]